MEIVEQIVAFLAGEEIRQVGSTLCQVMKEEVRRDLPKTKLPGCYDRLVRLITRLDDSVGSAHADWKKTRTNHDRIQMPSAVIFGKVIQSKRHWIFKVSGGGIREEKWVI